MKQEGSMTVFFCLMLLLISAIIGTCLESARTAGLRFMAKTASGSALQSVFAEYHEQLWEDYHVFFRHEPGSLETDFTEYLDYYAEPGLELDGLPDYTDFWDMTVEEAKIVSDRTMLSDGGQLFLEQAVEYEKYQIAENLVEKLLEQADLLDEVDKIRSFADRVGKGFEVLQTVSVLYQDVRDVIAGIGAGSESLKQLLEGEEPSLAELYAQMQEIRGQYERLGQSVSNYLQSAEKISELAQELRQEYGSEENSFYGEQIGQLETFTIMGEIGAAINRLKNGLGGLCAQLSALEAEIEQLLQVQEGNAEGEDTEGEETGDENTEDGNTEDGNTEDETGSGGGEDTETGGADTKNEGADPEAADSEAPGGQTMTSQDTGSESAKTGATQQENSGETDPADVVQRIKTALESGLSLVWEVQNGFESSGNSADSSGTGEAESTEQGRGLLDRVKQWKNMGILSLVLGAEAENTALDRISDASALPSIIMPQELPDVTAAQKGLFVFYIGDTFTSWRSETQKNFACQQEYILFGKTDSRSNLAAMAETLLAVREGLNLAYLLTDAEMKAVAEAAACALVGAVGLYPLVPVVKFVLLAAWAFAESVADVKALFRGERVPLWKSEGDWKTSLGGLAAERTVRQTGGSGLPEGNGIALSYEDYLKLFLFLNSTQKLCARSLDMIQEEIGRTEQGFLAADCYGAAEVEVSFSSPYRLITLPLIGVSSGTGHQIAVTAGYQYP